MSRHLPEGRFDFPCQAALPSSGPELNAWGWPGSVRGNGLYGGSSTGRRSTSSCALHHQRFNAAEHPPLPRASTAWLPQHLSAAIRALLHQRRGPPHPSSAEPPSSRGSLSRLASPAWTDFRARSRQPTLPRTSLVSRELLNHFPSQGMSSSTAPELLSAQGHGPTIISAGSVH